MPKPISLFLSPALIGLFLLAASACGDNDSNAGSDESEGKVIVISPPKPRQEAAPESVVETRKPVERDVVRINEFSPFGTPKIDRRKRDSRTAKSLSALTPDILAASHEKQFSKRPRPADFDLNSPAVKRYLDGISQPKPLAREKRRLKLLGDVRKTIANDLEKLPYSGKIKVRNEGDPNRASFKTGKILSADKNGVLFQEKDSSESVSCEWDKLTPDTLARIMEFHAKAKLKADKRRSQDGSGSGKKRADAASDLLRAAILADWYGEYKEARRLANAASDVSAELETLAESLFLD